MADQPVCRKLVPVPFTQVRVADRFWTPRIDVNREVTLRAEYKQLKETGRIDVFDLTWKEGMTPVPHQFWDSDVAKWVEAVAYSLADHPDPDLEALLDEVIAKIAGAQQPDGYLNTYFTLVKPQERFKHLSWSHELYSAGHLMEAAVAHFQATGKRTLLDVMTRYADYIDSYFGPGKTFGSDGHEEIELALVKLYHATGEERYLRLCEFFVNARGQHPGIFEEEWGGKQQAAGRDRSYCQDHLPVREMSEVTGHAVRAMYLYCGMADLANETGDEGLLHACERLWDHLTLKNMYLTGGIGSTRANEGFTRDYDLPNETAYCETCAAIGLVFWAHRLLQFDADGRYADTLERALYNGVISGVSLDGSKFFYVNPLESSGDHHRQDWFGCACCPPNIARILASLPGYLYSLAGGAEAKELYVHLYAAGTATLELAGQKVTVTQETDYPWDGTVKIRLQPEQPARFALSLRIPGWCKGARLTVDGEEIALKVRKGYVRVSRRWTGSEVVELTLPMPVERVEAHPEVKADSGCVALQRGPVVYCLESADNAFPLQEVVLPAEAEFKTAFRKNLLGGVVVLEAEALVGDTGGWKKQLYRPSATTYKRRKITAVPYCVWDNREPGAMRVWLRGTL
jgi:DUF1680 family protein